MSTAATPPASAPAAPAPDSTGKPGQAVFALRVVREDGSEFSGERRFDPTQQDARDIVFDLQLREGGPQPTKDEMDLYAAIGRVHDVLTELYPASVDGSEKRFRQHFVSLFYLARLALEGDSLDRGKTRGGRLGLELARNELKRIEDELIDDEEGRIKNQHLRELARWGAWFSAPLALAYLVLQTSAPGDLLHRLLSSLQIYPSVMANYLVLWVGCFIGVGLSYAYRKPRLALEDLVRLDTDRLNVPTRLVLAGLSTMLLVMLSAFGVFDITIGAASKLSSLSVDGKGSAMLAFAVGAICGISELALSGALSGKLKSVIPGGKSAPP